MRKRNISLEITGGFFGLLVALGLSALRIGNSSPPQRAEEALGNAVIFLILATPYIIALLSTRLPAGSRWVFLLPATLVSAASLVTALSGVTLLFLPATVMLGLAAWRSMDLKSFTGLQRAAFALAALLIFALAVASFASLFLNEDPRGWTYVTYEDGTTEWQSTAPIQSQNTTVKVIGISVTVTPGAATQGGHATSDVITNGEALRGAGLLAVAWIGFAILWRQASKFPTPYDGQAGNPSLIHREGLRDGQ